MQCYFATVRLKRVVRRTIHIYIYIIHIYIYIYTYIHIEKIADVSSMWGSLRLLNDEVDDDASRFGDADMSDFLAMITESVRVSKKPPTKSIFMAAL